MTAPVPCQSCGKMMSAAAVACPHCGARQVDRDPLPEGARPAPGPLAEAKLTREEMHALLAVESVTAPIAHVGPSLFRVLLLPHPMTHGALRAVDVLLTLAALPLVVVGVVPLLMFGRRRSFAVLTRSLRGQVELTAAVFAAVLGGLSVYITSILAPFRAVDPVLLVAVGVLALFVRVLVRRLSERA